MCPLCEEGCVKRRVDLIDQFAELVVGADDPRRLAERTLEVVMSLTNGRSGAVFTRDDDRITLFASRGIDQHVLDAIQTVWDRHREVFEKGETFYVPDRDSDSRLPKRASRTIYLRLQRYNIPRERVPKTRTRAATA